ncbi:MAG: hypothetical protein ACO1PW_08085 [Actinomycetota bacterium]
MRSPRALRHLRALAVVLALSFVAAACGDEADDDPLGGDTTTTEGTADDGDRDGDDGDDSAGLPDGWQVIEGEGVAIAVPGDWIDVPLEELEMGSEDFRELMPDADEALINQAAQVVQQGGVLLSFGPPVDDFTDNLNILELPVSAELDELEREAELGMQAMNADLLSLDRVELPVGEAVRVRYSAEFQSPDGPFTVEGVQFYVPLEGVTYVLTVSTSTDPDAIADDMATSFEVG